MKQDRYQKKTQGAKPPQKIGDVLTDLMARRGYAQVKSNEDCHQAWQQVVGKLGKFTRAGDIKRGVLHVVVSNSVMMQELTFRKAEIVAAMDRALPQHQIRDLRFKVGKIQ